MRIRLSSTRILVLSALLILIMPLAAETPEPFAGSAVQWQSPSEEILEVLYAPQLPWSWTSPTGEYMLLTDPVLYPTLEELAAPMHQLAGIRVDPVRGCRHGIHGSTSPRLIEVETGSAIPLELPETAEVYNVDFSADGQRFALTVIYPDHMGLWVGSIEGELREIQGITLNTLLGDAVSWTPDQEHLLVLSVPSTASLPTPPAIPAGPNVMEGIGAAARSTYEARNLLETSYDDDLFDYFSTSEPVLIDPAGGSAMPIGDPDHYYNVEYSPDGNFILVERLVGPWSHEVAWWRFAMEVEVWSREGEFVATVASLPLADAVPIHGEREGPRSVQWRPTAPHQLFWVEALDGGDPIAEVAHRDRLMRLEEPFTQEPEEVFRAEHRIYTWRMPWTAEGNTLMLTQWERMSRREYVWLLDVETGDANLWYQLDESDRYSDPGNPVMRLLPNSERVMHQRGSWIYFSGTGATETGDRPFLDLRDMASDETDRIFRCDPDHYQYFVSFAGGEDRFIIRSESNSEVPNYFLVNVGDEVQAGEGEGERELSMVPVTEFQDPSPQLREITSEIVHYEREDGVPLSFHLYLPPDYQEGTHLPTVIDAYPMEYSSASTAGQVSGSSQRFMRLYGSSSLYFLLEGYAVLARTAMPMIGDPETVYDTFVPQLVADAQAAVEKAVEIGVADPDRIGIIGHSHGALMVANLLAHTDLFQAGIARSGSYNKTNQPFGFQSERRSLFEARDVYIQLSPTFFADGVNEPILIIHGEKDSNPGTRTYQSEIFYEAVRGSGGTARLVLLPFEDHGYRAQESIEHVLWEQLRWFGQYLKAR